MKTTTHPKREISGLSIRTKNANETDTKTAKIGPLWGSFFQTVAPRMSQNSIVYGVYSNYESDMNGEFDVLAGTDVLQDKSGLALKNVTLAEGNYMVFSETGAMPQSVFSAWGKVWAYFTSPKCQHQRAYKTDFEVYVGADKVDVYIGIK